MKPRPQNKQSITGLSLPRWLRRCCWLAGCVDSGLLEPQRRDARPAGYSDRPRVQDVQRLYSSVVAVGRCCMPETGKAGRQTMRAVQGEEMSRAIYADIPELFKLRMQNWARWEARGMDASLAPSSMWSAAASGTRGAPTIITLGGEAMDTNAALNGMPARYAQAVRLFWQYENASLTYRARRCCCERHTFESRVIEGHTILRSEIFKRTEAAEMAHSAYERMSAA